MPLAVGDVVLPQLREREGGKEALVAHEGDEPLQAGDVVVLAHEGIVGVAVAIVVVVRRPQVRPRHAPTRQREPGLVFARLSTLALVALDLLAAVPNPEESMAPVIRALLSSVKLPAPSLMSSLSLRSTSAKTS